MGTGDRAGREWSRMSRADRVVVWLAGIVLGILALAFPVFPVPTGPPTGPVAPSAPSRPMVVGLSFDQVPQEFLNNPPAWVRKYLCPRLLSDQAAGAPVWFPAIVQVISGDVVIVVKLDSCE